MKKNSTLPYIREAKQSPKVTNRSKELNNFKKIEEKLILQNSQIVRNQKIIFSLTNQFHVLKQQLQYQQKLNEQHEINKSRINNQNIKLIKNIRDYKLQLQKLQTDLNQKEANHKKILKGTNKETISLKEFYQLEQESKILKKDLQLRTQYGKKKNTEVQILKEQLKKNKEKLNEIEKQLEIIPKMEIQILQLKQQLQKMNVELKNKNSLLKITEKDLTNIRKQYEASRENLLQNINDQKYIAELKTKQKSIIEENSQLIKNGHKLEKQIEKLLINSNQIDYLKKQQLKLIQQNQDYRNNIEILSLELQKEKKIIQKNNQQYVITNSIKQKFQKLKKISQNLKISIEKLKQSIICQMCNCILKQAVTSIPCGHSYCLECKIGYEKSCKKCNNKVKRQAVYRNELMDEIIAMYNFGIDLLKMIQL